MKKTLLLGVIALVTAISVLTGCGNAASPTGGKSKKDLSDLYMTYEGETLDFKNMTFGDVVSIFNKAGFRGPDNYTTETFNGERNVSFTYYGGNPNMENMEISTVIVAPNGESVTYKDAKVKEIKIKANSLSINTIEASKKRSGEEYPMLDGLGFRFSFDGSDAKELLCNLTDFVKIEKCNPWYYEHNKEFPTMFSVHGTYSEPKVSIYDDTYYQICQNEIIEAYNEGALNNDEKEELLERLDYTFFNPNNVQYSIEGEFECDKYGTGRISIKTEQEKIQWFTIKYNDILSDQLNVVERIEPTPKENVYQVARDEFEIRTFWPVCIKDVRETFQKYLWNRYHISESQTNFSDIYDQSYWYNE